MAIIVKCNPPGATEDGVCTVEERVFYGARPEPGQTVYIWESETAGGHGLAMRGQIEDVHRLAGRQVQLRIRIDADRTAQPFTVAILAPYRDVRDDGALSGLARKLYRNAHNKIALLTATEEDFLHGFF